MFLRSRSCIAGALSIIAMFVAACDSGSDSAPAPTASGVQGADGSATTSGRPTLTGSSIQPPPQDKQEARDSGRPKVVFDPCTWVPDDAVAKLGFDVSSRARLADAVGEYTFLTCQFDSKDSGLQLLSGNITLEEDKAKYSQQIRQQGLQIDGREAIIVNKTGSQDCQLDMRTKVGYFEVAVIMNTPGLVKGIKGCDQIVETATALEPYIGKDN
ncbi:MAG: DUF3558 domain-containing protein [Nocardia sp.]|nr:DUF3558 domain-containing protein [Nocardia sp.]